MAVFLLDISGKPGSKIFSDRLHNNAYEKDSVIVDPDIDGKMFNRLGIDPYTDTYWSGVSLQMLETTVQKQFEEIEKQIENTVLQNMDKYEIEEWMVPIIDKERMRSPNYRMLERLLTLIGAAKIHDGTVIYLGD